MPRLFPCERAGLEIFDDAPFRSRNSIDLSISPQQLWNLLAEIETWPVIKRSTRKQTRRLRKHIEQRFGPTIHYSG